MEYPKECPHCKAQFEKEDIYEYFLKKYGNEERALKAAGFYGWTKELPCRFSRIIAVISVVEDRTIYFMCPDCKGRMERE